MYGVLLARSFRKNEKHKLIYGALVTFAVTLYCFIVVLKPSLAPDVGESNVNRESTLQAGISLRHGTDRINLSCNFTKMSDYCELRGDVRLNGRDGTIQSLVEEDFQPENLSLIVRPYGRKSDPAAMVGVRPWNVKVSQINDDALSCTVNHTVPGIVFSVGAYAGNHFHSFSDILVPLFAAAKPFNGEVKLIITDENRNPDWVPKFQKLLKGLSRYDEIFPDNDANDIVHCFTYVLVGAKHRSHKELSLEMAGTPYKVTDFMSFLRNTYGLKKSKAIKLQGPRDKRKPRLLIISRKKTRVFINIGAISGLAEEMGFEVVVDEPGADMQKAAEVMNGCDVALGVHGAGLTNAVFLAEKAVLIQVVPFGGAEWVSRTFFGEPSIGMKLRYIEYKIGIEESTLTAIYPRDDIVFRDPQFFKDQGWHAYRRVYFDQQDIHVNITRLKPILHRTMELLKR